MRLALALALALTGCCFGGSELDSPEGVESDEGEVSVPEGDDLFVYAIAERAHDDAPARLRAPIPPTLSGFRHWPDDAAPYNQVQARLGVADPSTIALWLDAATTAARSAPAIDVAAGYADIVRYGGPRIASELRRRATTTPTPGAHETVLLALALQGRARDAALFTAENAPPSATIAWFGERSPHRVTPDEATRLRTALEAHLPSYTPTDDPIAPCGEGVTDVVRLLADAGQTEALRAWAASLGGARGACVQDALRIAADPPAAPRDPDRTVLEEVQDVDFEIEAVPAGGAQHDAIVEALATCAAGVDYVAVECLGNLALVDRPRAVAVARTWRAAHPELASAHELAHALDAFQDESDVIAYLRQQQMIAADEDTSDLGTAITPVEVLEELGHALLFDTETDRYPNEHDTLLIQLSGLSPATLHGIAFEEVVEDEDDVEAYGERLEGDEPVVGYLLFAYDGHTRYEVYADGMGDWYDVDAVIGMLDTLSYVRHADVRWLSLDTGDQIARVVAGPEAGLRALVRDGWLVPTSRGQSEASQGAEDQLLQQMLGSESPPP